MGWVVYPAYRATGPTDFYPVGFPAIIRAGGFCPPDFVCVEFSWIPVIIDLAVWYLVSAIIVMLAKKIRTQKSV